MMDELRELDVKVAEALGCKVRMTDVASAWSWGQMSQDAVCGCDRDEHGCYPHGTDAEWSAPDRLRHYSTDIAAAWGLEDWLEVHHPELRNDYATALYGLTCHVWQQPGVCKGWAMAHAMPAQRCRAFLAAMEGQC